MPFLVKISTLELYNVVCRRVRAEIVEGCPAPLYKPGRPVTARVLSLPAWFAVGGVKRQAKAPKASTGGAFQPKEDRHPVVIKALEKIGRVRIDPS